LCQVYWLSATFRRTVRPRNMTLLCASGTDFLEFLATSHLENGFTNFLVSLQSPQSFKIIQHLISTLLITILLYWNHVKHKTFLLSLHTHTHTMLLLSNSYSSQCWKEIFSYRNLHNNLWLWQTENKQMYAGVEPRSFSQQVIPRPSTSYTPYNPHTSLLHHSYPVITYRHFERWLGVCIFNINDIQ